MADASWFEDLRRLGDAELVARARELRSGGARDVEAARRCLALVYERHRTTVRLACGARAPREAVDDLEARAYERFVRAVHTSADPIQNPVGLLVTLARWAVADYHEARRLRPEQLEGDPDRHRAQLGDGVVDALAERSFMELLAPLSERQRQVVVLRIGQDLPSSEAGRRLGLSAGNVDVILHRALERLRGEMPA